MPKSGIATSGLALTSLASANMESAVGCPRNFFMPAMAFSARGIGLTQENDQTNPIYR